MQAQHRALAARHLLLVEGVDHEGERAAVRARGGLDHVRDVALARRRVDVVELLARELGVTAEVVIRSIGDALQLRPAHREQVLDVARPGRVMGQLVGARGRAAAGGRAGCRGPCTSACDRPSSAGATRSASGGGTKNSISICSNSRVRKMKLPGVISLRNALPIWAMPNGGLRRANWSTFLKFTKMPCAVSGRRKMRAASSRTGPMNVSNIRLNWRASPSSPPHSGQRSSPLSPGSRWSARHRLLHLPMHCTSGSVKLVHVAGGLPRARVHQDRRVEGHHVVALLHDRPPPLPLDVVLQQNPVVAVVVGGGQAAVDLGGLEDEPAPLAERDDLLHRDRVHRAVAGRGSPWAQDCEDFARFLPFRWGLLVSGGRPRLAVRGLI